MELAQVTQELIRIERETHRLAAQIQAEAATYCIQTEQGVAIEYVLEWQARMDAQQAALNELHRATDALTQSWTETQARLVAASQDRKVLERLAARRRHAQDTDTARREQHLSDEAAARRHNQAGHLA
jgi:flagellar biosynthesis chaperone FliJ